MDLTEDTEGESTYESQLFQVMHAQIHLHFFDIPSDD